MSISELTLAPNQSDHLKNKLVRDAKTRAAGDISSDLEESRPVNSASDRVEISESARNARARTVHAGELDFARKALAASKPLGDERIAEIKARLDEAYYQNPEASDAVAAGLAAAILGTDV